MNITVIHTIHPDVIALLEKFVNPGSGGQQLNGKEVAAPVETVTPKKTRAVVTKETPAAESPAAAPEAETKKLEFTDIRQLYLQKKEEGKQELVKKEILDAYQVEKLSQFKPEQFEEVYKKMKAL